MEVCVAYRIILLLFLILILNQCKGSSTEHGSIKKIKPIVKFFRKAEPSLGNKFLKFDYMYPLTEKEAETLGNFFRVLYNKKGDVLNSEEYVEHTLRDGIIYYHTPDFKKIITIKKHDGSRTLSTYRFNYENKDKIIMTHYNDVDKIVGKKIDSYNNSQLTKQEIFQNDKKVLELQYNYKNPNDYTIKYIQNNKNILTQTYEKGLLVIVQLPNGSSKSYSYNDNSRITEEKIFTKDKLNQSIKKSYDEKGNLTKIQSYNNNNKPHGKWFEIDEKGNLKKIEIHKNGTLVYHTNFINNDKGLLSKEETFRGKRLLHYYQYFYNDKNYFLKRIKYNPNKKPLEREEYKYEDGRLTLKEYFKNNKIVRRQVFRGGEWNDISTKDIPKLDIPDLKENKKDVKKENKDKKE